MAIVPKELPRSFDAPQESEWHRMIAEAAYFLAQKRGFLGERSLDDWLAAEQQVRQVISPVQDSKTTLEATMDDTGHDQTKSDATLAKANEQASGSSRQETRAKADPGTAQQSGMSRFAKFAATQAAGDGIQGDALKNDKTVDEQIGANMADRK